MNCVLHGVSDNLTLNSSETPTTSQNSTINLNQTTVPKTTEPNEQNLIGDDINDHFTDSEGFDFEKTVTEKDQIIDRLTKLEVKKHWF